MSIQDYPFDAYISYSPHDKTWVEQVLIKQLEQDGFKLFFDERDFRPGISVIKERERGIANSRTFLAILTPAYIASEWCDGELKFAQTLDPNNEQGRIIPLLIENCYLPEDILMIARINFTEKSRESEAWIRLRRSIEDRYPQIVLLIHGIRTHAFWQEVVAENLEDQRSISVIPLRYGYLDTLRFWLPGFTREIAINKVSRRIRFTLGRYPKSKISIIAHSFGTYTIGNILLKNKDLRIFRLILCGSILPTEFPWSKIQTQVESDIINDCGTRDIWPVLAQSMTWGYGASGVFGFGHTGIRDRFHNYSHGDYFNIDFVNKFWKPYIKDGQIIRSEWDTKKPNPPFWIDFLANTPFKYVILLVLFCLFMVLGFYLQGNIRY